MQISEREKNCLVSAIAFSFCSLKLKILVLGLDKVSLKEGFKNLVALNAVVSLVLMEPGNNPCESKKKTMQIPFVQRINGSNEG